MGGDNQEYQPPWWFSHIQASKNMPGVKPWEWEPAKGEDRRCWLYRTQIAAIAENEADEARRKSKKKTK